MSDQSPNSSLSYKQAGVDIDAGNAFVDAIKPLVAATQRAGVMTDIGGFGGLFKLPAGLSEPILVSGTDGVGTKLLLARDQSIHNTIGIDLVAMCVNDVLVQGAEPLFFLDYFACGKLETGLATDVVAGISAGCQLAGCALIGGETAEMPGMYAEGHYDLAGFSVGVVDRVKLIDGSNIKAGDHVIGLDSSGPHSNGYSLIRSVLEKSQPDLAENCGGQSLIEALLAPTHIYVKAVQACLAQFSIAGMAHITGGGLAENLARVLPDTAGAVIDANSWQLPLVFQWLSEQGPIDMGEMRRVFNCGVGYVLIVDATDSEQAVRICAENGISGRKIGEIVVRGDAEDPVKLDT